MTESPDQAVDTQATGATDEETLFDEFGYMKFDVPWSMNVAYSINYSKPYLKSQVNQTLMVNGNVSLTKENEYNV